MKNDVAIVEEEHHQFPNNDIMDLSLLNPPKMKNKPNIGSFLEAKKAYDQGDETRLLLLFECFIIYECKKCRNMFRNFQNFMSHKRLFCCDKSMNNCDANSNGFSDQSSVVVEKETSSRIANPLDSSDYTSTSNKIDQNDVQMIGKSLIKPVPIAKLLSENTNKVEEGGGGGININIDSIKISQQQQQQQQQPHEQEQQRNETGNDSAVFSGLHLFSNQQTNDVISVNESKVSEIIKENHNKKNSESKKNQNIGQVQFKCNICGTELQTSKALKVHIQKKHSYINNVSNCVLQCPSCSKNFSHTSALFQHLSAEHNFSSRRIRMLREAIAKRRVQNRDKFSEDNTTAPKQSGSQDVKCSQINAADAGGANLTLKDNNTENCSFCHKTFDHNTALTAHLVHCTSKLESADCRKSKNFSIEQSYINQEKKLKLCPANEIPNNSFQFFNESLPHLQQQQQEQQQQQQNELFKLTSNEDATDCLNVNSLFADLENKDFGCGLQTVSIGTLKALIEDNEASLLREENRMEVAAAEESNAIGIDSPATPLVKGEDMSTSNQQADLNPGSAKKVQKVRKVTPIKQLCRCKICGKQFNALSNLRRHISMFHYRSRKYGCALCDYCAFRRYDIINHLVFVHKMTGERDSMSAEYVKVNEVNYTKDDMDGDIMLCSEVSKDSPVECGEKPNPAEATSEVEALNSSSDITNLVLDSNLSDLKIEKKVIKTYEKRAKCPEILQVMDAIETSSQEEKEEVRLDYDNDNDEAKINIAKVQRSQSEVQSHDSEVQINTRQMLRRSLSSTTVIADSKIIPNSLITSNVSETIESIPESAPKKALGDANRRRSFAGRLTEGRPRTPQRRPIRNRIKPVNKDFVYDLAHANPPPAENVNKEVNTRPVRRRCTINKDSFVDQAFAMTVTFSPLNQKENYKLIKGSARRIALFLINQGQAVLPTLPEMPTARPLIRPRPPSSSIDDGKTMAPIIETTELEAARMKSTLLEDTFLREKICKQSTSEFRIKPSLASSQYCAVDSLLQKVDLSLQNRSQGQAYDAVSTSVSQCELSNNGGGDSDAYNGTIRAQDPANEGTSHTSPVTTLSPINQLFDKIMKYEASPTPQPAGGLPPARPRKRNSMVDRLDEANKLYIESKYLRRALEN